MDRQDFQEKAVSHGLWDSVFVAIMVGTAETFAIIFAVTKGLSHQAVALLTTLPILLGALAQWVLPPLIVENNLKKNILYCHIIQILGLCFLLASVFLENHLLWIFLALSFYWLGGMVMAPLWLDWMSLWFKEDGHFSKFLSRRNALVALVTLGSYILVSFCIYQVQSTFMYALPFMVALVSRLASSWTVFTQPSPPAALIETNFVQQEESLVSAKSIFLMIAFTTVFRIVSNISSPFFIPYMLNDLKLPLMTYVTLTAVPFVGRFLFLARWEHTRKSIHPFTGLILCMFGICISPYLWSLTRNPHYIFFFELFSGIMWGCFELCTILLLQSYRRGRARGLLGMHLAFMSLASLVGAMMGAYGLSHLHMSYTDLFVSSAGLRFIVALAFAIVIMSSQWRKTRLQVYGDFLSNVLSLRPSLANIGRLIPATKKTTKKSGV